MENKQEKMIMEFRKELSLNNTEAVIMSQLTKNKRMLAIAELVEIIGKDRTTVQKILIKLQKQPYGYVVKRQVNLNRGFMFVYQIFDFKELEDKIEKILVTRLNQFKEMKNER